MKLFLIISLLGFSSCSERLFHYVKSNNNKSISKYSVLKIDTTYTLYTRNGCKISNDDASAIFNCETLAAGNERVEIQYLLISKIQNKALYFTTIPPFHYKGNEEYFVYNYPLFNNDSSINIWFLNTFHFGKYDTVTNKVAFKKKNRQEWMYWQLSDDDNKIIIQTMYKGNDSLPLEASFASPLQFYKKNRFKFILNGNIQNAPNGCVVNSFEHNIYYKITLNSKKMKLYFKTDTTIPKNCTNLKKVQFIRFDNNRVTYDPSYLNELK
jgi:hypothetical protein